MDAFQREHQVGWRTRLSTDTVGCLQLTPEQGNPAALAPVWRHQALVREVLEGFADAEEFETVGDSLVLLFS